jgi:cytochrome P450
MERSRQHYLGLRTVTVDDQLSGSVIRLKKGEQVFISIYNRGRDRRY